MTAQDEIEALVAAVARTPEDAGLRRLLAGLLSADGRHEEAEAEYKAALRLAPDAEDLKLGLADCLHRQGDLSGAIALLEALGYLGEPSAEALSLKARLLLEAGKVDRAVEAYHQAVEQDPGAEDALLARRLGVGARQDGPSEVVEGRVRQCCAPEAPAPEMERPDSSFADVGGMEALKEEVRMKIILPLEKPEIYRAYGKTVGGGILMYGPPGCGKTHLARATAGEVKATFMSVGIADVLDMWIGQSERNLHELFEQARQAAPAVLFFDEVDALGARRSDMRQSAGRHLINQFLAELDGLDSSNEGVLILAATNAPWHLDGAFRRPGRFDRMLFVPPPDHEARDAILRIHCRGKPTHKVAFGKLAGKTKGFSGADLSAVVEQAVEGKIREAMRSGQPEPLTTRDLTRAAKGVNPSTADWFATARNHVLYSNRGGLYDPVREFLGMK